MTPAALPHLDPRHAGLNHTNDFAAMRRAEPPEAPPARTMQPVAETTNQPSDTPDATRRKRLSFFGRSNSDASTKEKPRSPMQTLMSAPHTVVVAPLNAQPKRPATANSEQRRRTTDPLESIRHSLFGGRKSTSGGIPVPSISSKSRRARHSQSIDGSGVEPANTAPIPATAPSRPEFIEGRPQSGHGQQDFRNEKDFYHHRKKSSISPPFNFKHVTHTSNRHLPRLDTVDEKDLPRRFCSPDMKLQEASEDIPQQAMSRISTRKTSRVRETTRERLDETRFDETRDTKFTPDSFHDQSGPHIAPVRPPKHHSSMGALSSSSSSSVAHTMHHLKNPGSYGGLSRAVQEAPHANGWKQHSKSLTAEPTLPPETLPDAQITQVPQRRPPGQPLPPLPGSPPAHAIKLPGHVVKKKLSRGSVGSRQSVTGLNPAQTNMAVNRAASIQCKMSAKSFGTSQSSGPKRTDILEEPSWEDDIDFAFEQGAEAMCDFDWESLPAPLRKEDEHVQNGVVSTVASPPLSDQSTPESAGSGDVRLSAWADQPAAFGCEPSIVPSVGSPDLTDIQHKRGSSVGHRGFLAARHANSDASPQKTPKTPLTVELVNGSQTSPFASSAYFPVLDNSIPEYLSDPESIRTGSSRHRKSSSYGSYDSSGRSLKTSSETTRWSSASTSSIPDLLHSQMAKKGRRISKPLESVPHSPDSEVPPALPREDSGQQLERTLRPGPRAPVDRSRSDETIIMRRPSNAGDRTLLFQSGRVVQRGRSMLPSLRARIQSMPAVEQEGGWI